MREQIITDSFFVSMTFYEDNRTRYTCVNGVDLRHSNTIGFSLSRDDDTYVLCMYKVIANKSDLSLEEREHETVCKWNKSKGVFDVNYESLTSVRTNDSPSVAMFLNLLLTNHPDTVSATNVWHLLRRHHLVSTLALANVSRYYDSITSIEKLGDNFIKNIDQKELVLNDASERHKLLGVPKKALRWIEEQVTAGNITSGTAKEMIDACKIIAKDDPNQLIDIINYFIAYDKVMAKIPANTGHSFWYSNACGYFSTLLDNIAEAKQLRELDARRLLNYLIKQNFNQLYNDSNRGDPIRYSITLPSKLAGIYCDYLRMNPDDLFPQDLYRAHNVLAIESKLPEWSEEEKLAFANYGTSLSNEYDDEIDGYHFIVPTNYDEFISIGKTFMNCLPYCGKAFVNGLCNIVFIYEDLSKYPRFAIEIGQNNELIQAKTIHDNDISEQEVLDVLDKYLKKIDERK